MHSRHAVLQAIYLEMENWREDKAKKPTNHVSVVLLTSLPFLWVGMIFLSLSLIVRILLLVDEEPE